MKLLVGLGNPGSQYEKTRHNAGFFVIDRLARRWVSPGGMGEPAKGRFSGICQEVSIKGPTGEAEKCLLLKPTTYMNLSGKSVAEAIGFYKLNPATDLLVIVDDVALPTGTIRIRASGSPGGHNGLTDIQRALGTDLYPRLRIGIDACPPMMKLEDYVLGRFTAEQLTLLEPALNKAADAAQTFITHGLTKAMNTFNSPPPSPTPPLTKPPTSDSPKVS
jgi:peptidyl-tRNA hydrolase, PTH1 family